jgi:hypothetical protein
MGMHTLQSGGEESLVLDLIRGNLLQVGIEGVLHASLDEVSLGVVLETLLVKGGLKVLESQSIVENVG